MRRDMAGLYARSGKKNTSDRFAGFFSCCCCFNPGKILTVRSQIRNRKMFLYLRIVTEYTGQM